MFVLERYTLSWNICRDVITGSNHILIFVFINFTKLIFNMVVLVYVLESSCHLLNPWHFYTFRFCKSDGWEVLYHRKLNLHFMVTKKVEHVYCSIIQFVVDCCWWFHFLFCLFLSPAQFFFTCSFSHWDTYLFLIDFLKVFMCSG